MVSRVARRSGAALVLALLTTAPVPARGACPRPTATTQALPDAAAARVGDAQALADRGDCAAAGDALTAAYDLLGGQPRRNLDLLHALLADAVHQYVAVDRQANAGEPGPLCAADTLALRHRARVRAIGRATPTFEATISDLRLALHARLLADGARCSEHGPPAGPASTAPKNTALAYTSGDLLLAPGRLAAATRERRPPVAPQRRWQATKRAGFALMSIGLMTLGGGIAAGALERAPGREALQASLLVGGTGLFVAGFPLLIVGDQRARAALAVGPGGARLAF